MSSPLIRTSSASVVRPVELLVSDRTYYLTNDYLLYSDEGCVNPADVTIDGLPFNSYPALERQYLFDVVSGVPVTH